MLLWLVPYQKVLFYFLLLVDKRAWGSVIFSHRTTTTRQFVFEFALTTRNGPDSIGERRMILPSANATCRVILTVSFQSVSVESEMFINLYWFPGCDQKRPMNWALSVRNGLTYLFNILNATLTFCIWHQCCWLKYFFPDVFYIDCFLFIAFLVLIIPRVLRYFVLV